MTVTATAVIINLVVILILDEIYGAVAKWLTKIGTVSPHCMFALGPLEVASSVCAGFLVPVTQHKKKEVQCAWRNEEVQGVSL